jgi:mono/diheme cytochrome c family protein
MKLRVLILTSFFLLFVSTFLILWNSTTHSHEPGIEVPEEYAQKQAPEYIWTSPETLAKGKKIYTTYCLSCHGEKGDGRGPVAQALNPKPSDFSDKKMVSKMPANYWFWRVSEGGRVEPFRSKGSAMPAWKSILSEEDIWAVIAYEHTFSEHQSPPRAKENSRLENGGKHQNNARD